MPLEDKPTLLKLLQLDLETHPPNAAILSLELHAQSAAPYRAQHGLFLPQAPEPGRLEVVLARLRKLLGEERVGSVELKDDHRPNAFRMVPFAPPPPKKSGAAIALCRNRTAGLPSTAGYRRGAHRQCASASLLGWAAICRPGDRGTVARQRAMVVGSQLVPRRMGCAAGRRQSAERVCRIAFDPRSRCWYVQGTYD